MILIEALSIVVRGEAFDRNYIGGWDAFLASTPHERLCADDEIAGQSFLTRDDALEFLAHLHGNGVLAADVGLVSQTRGVLTTSPWLDFGTTGLSGFGRVAVCRLAGSVDPQLFLPPGWQYRGSQSERAAAAGVEMFAALRRQ